MLHIYYVFLTYIFLFHSIFANEASCNYTYNHILLHYLQQNPTSPIKFNADWSYPI